MRDTGRVLFFVGLALAAFGLLAWVGALNWFGRLPGDIRIVSARSVGMTSEDTDGSVWDQLR